MSNKVIALTVQADRKREKAAQRPLFLCNRLHLPADLERLGATPIVEKEGHAFRTRVAQHADGVDALNIGPHEFVANGRDLSRLAGVCLLTCLGCFGALRTVSAFQFGRARLAGLNPLPLLVDQDRPAFFIEDERCNTIVGLDESFSDRFAIGRRRWRRRLRDCATRPEGDRGDNQRTFFDQTNCLKHELSPCVFR